MVAAGEERWGQRGGERGAAAAEQIVVEVGREEMEEEERGKGGAYLAWKEVTVVALVGGWANVGMRRLKGWANVGECGGGYGRKAAAAAAAPKAKVVLQGLWGYADAGKMMAIMGASGSGKTTLLDALAGRLAANTVQTGTIRLNGDKRRLSYGKAAYVTQEDNLLGTLTVQESVWYSAKARLPSHMPYAEKQALVETAIFEMGLQDCSNTYVGNWHIRGISNGEKRRLNIAIEILLQPYLLFLDEPTSGLDSASAFFVIRTLKNLAKGGRTIIASIHQPSSDVFQLFDTLYLLARGRTIYFGQVKEANNFFAKSGFPCPPLRNPSDHFLRCINGDFDRVRESLKKVSNKMQASMNPLENRKTTEIIDILLYSYNESTYASTAMSKTQMLLDMKGPKLELRGSHASLMKQAMTLTQRSFINMSRDIGYYWLRLVIYILVSICVGTVFYNVGTSYDAILARGSCAAFTFGFVTFMSIGGFPSFIEDMKVFYKERLNGHYEVISFVVAHALSSIPFVLLIAIISSSICYFMVGLHPGFVHYLYFMLLLFFCVLVVEGLMMAIASIVPNFLMGIIIGACIQGLFMLVAGYIRLPNDIPKPVWRYPIAYMSFGFWAAQGQSQNDFHGLIFEDQSGNPVLTGDLILTQFFQIDVNRSKWWDLSVIFSMVFIYRIIFLICIKLNEDVAPWVKGYLARKSLGRANIELLKYNGDLSLVQDSTLQMATPERPMLFSK